MSTANYSEDLSVAEGADFQSDFSNKGSNLTCITCRLYFSNAKDQKLHFKSDLHRFNLKRKVASLPSVTQQIFDLKVKNATPAQETTELENFKCDLCNKVFASSATFNQHMKSKKHLDTVKQGIQPRKSETKKQSKSEEKETETDESSELTIDNTDNELTPEELEYLNQKIKTAKRLTLEDCLFCNQKSVDFESNMTHMTKEHSLFIPDIEYVKDLQGLIKYLGEKVSIGNICLYCNGKGRSFHTLEAVQAHMTALSHCKILYDNNEEEYEDYYDFSSDYANKDENTTTTVATIDPNIKSQVQLSDDGNMMVFANGKSIGHRTLSLYYRQHYKLPETRESVLVNQLMSQYRLLGWYENHTSAPDTTRKNERTKQDFQLKIGTKNNNQRHHRKQNAPIA